MASYDPKLDDVDVEHLSRPKSKRKFYLALGTGAAALGVSLAVVGVLAGNAATPSVKTAPLPNVVADGGMVEGSIVEDLGVSPESAGDEASAEVTSSDSGAAESESEAPSAQVTVPVTSADPDAVVGNESVKEVKLETSTSGGQDVLVDENTGTVYVPDVMDLNVPEMVSSKCLPSVVSISVTVEGAVSNGSGVIIDDAGHVLTNDHVILGSDNITVKANGNTYRAYSIGSDPTSDLAVLQLDLGGTQVTPIEVGDSSTLKIGQWVMAIGSPFGLEQSVTQGIISSLARSTVLPSWSGTNVYTNLIQTDAATNPGSSGGALVDSAGKLVGINSIISSYDGSFSGVGFAIPVNYAMDVAHAIIDGHAVEHACLGVNLATVTPEVAANSGLGIDKGAYITDVLDGSAAAASGISLGDIVVGIGDQSVESAEGLIAAVRSLSPGTETMVSVCRGSEIIQIGVTLGSDGGAGLSQA